MRAFTEKARKTRPWIDRLLTGVHVYFLLALPLFVIYETKIGIWPEELLKTLRGNPNLLIPPLPIEELLIHIHIKLFMQTFMALTVAAVSYRYFKENKWLSRGAIFLFLSIFLDNLFLILSAINTWGGWSQFKFLFFALTILTLGAFIYTNLTKRNHL